MDYEVDQPILNSPYKEPAEYWHIMEGETPKRMPGRRKAMYYYRQPSSSADDAGSKGTAVELTLVNLIRDRLADWRTAEYAGVSRTSLELLRYWRREGRLFRLFFAQIEAVETVIFLVEARADLRQGIEIQRDEPGEDGIQKGYSSFLRYACKMATGSGKTMVMGMLAAWSILNKVAARTDNRFSDTVLAVCPNVTIRNRLQELDPRRGEASIYRTKDLVPPHLMTDLARGRVLVTNWHVFEPQSVQVGGVSARVSRAGVAVQVPQTISIGTKTGTSRGTRYLTEAELARQVAAGLIEVREEIKDSQGTLKKVRVDATRYVESDAAVVNRVLGRHVGGKKNILVFNDEAHHAYRIRRDDSSDGGDEDGNGDGDSDGDETEDFFQEATVWIEGLDRINKLRGINLCVDLSATPYYLGRVGQKVNQTFPWVVSDFGLTDAIESGLVKIPQLAVRDSTGADIPGYFNIWRFIWEKLTPAERGGAHARARPEAILKWANHPISMLGSHWDEMRKEWETHKDDPRPPVFILVCKDTKIAKVIYEWMAEDNPPAGIPKCGIAAFRNSAATTNTIRVDSRVVQETDSAEAKSDESAWMRLTLDTVGKVSWPEDRQGKRLYPEGFEELAEKLARPLHPPGRDIRCIVSVGMLTEGWDCSTVTHIIGLRPFMSQLLCEQVVGRGLRRASYQVGEDDLLTEEVSKVFGVPFEVIPFKASPDGNPPPPVKRAHVHALPEKSSLEITFPRVVGYRQAIRNRVTVNWDSIAVVSLDPVKIPPEVEVKAALPNNKGRPSLQGPGKLESLDLSKYRESRREQELSFELARDLTKYYMAQGGESGGHGGDYGGGQSGDHGGDHPPAHVLFPQVAALVQRYLREKVVANPPAHILDIFLSPYYGWVIERLNEAIKPDAGAGEEPEVPVLEANRGPGSTSEVDFWTSKDVREVVKSHLNYVVADTKVWEQAAAYVIDTHPGVAAFVKNAGLGFSIPYLHNGQPREYVPDFIVRLAGTPGAPGAPGQYLVLETKGFDELADIKAQAAERWVQAVNSDGSFGTWRYAMARKVEQVREILSQDLGK